MDSDYTRRIQQAEEKVENMEEADARRRWEEAEARRRQEEAETRRRIQVEEDRRRRRNDDFLYGAIGGAALVDIASSGCGVGGCGGGGGGGDWGDFF